MKTAPDRPVPSWLAPDFEPTSYDDWRERTLSELGGADFEQALCRPPLPGAPPRQPLYSARDLAGEDPGGLPGGSLHVRGWKPLGKNWIVAQEFREPSEVINSDPAALDDLVSAGVGLVAFDLGTNALKPGLERLDLSRVAAMVTGPDIAISAVLLLAEARRQGVAPKDLRGCLGFDPIGRMARQTYLSGTYDRAWDLAAEFITWSQREAPGMRALMIDLSPHHDAGADPVLELALLAATAVEVLRRLDGRGLVAGRRDVDVVGEEMLLALSVGGDFFTEIAKLRAARLLWSKVMRACGGSEGAGSPHLHVRTSAVSRTVRGPWTNMLRETTQGFAAALGGADSIATAPFDDRLGLPESSSRRLAVTTQHVLREEAGAGQVLDPAGGSYYLERWTDELARAAWTIFQEIEGEGGLLPSWRQGLIHRRIVGQAELRQRDTDRRKSVLVGINEFADPDEELPRRGQPDPIYPRPPSKEELDFEQPSNLGSAIEVALGGASMHRLGATLWGANPSLAQFRRFYPHVLAEPFEALREISDEWRERHGQRPRVFLAQIGQGRDFRPRSGYATGFFAAGGLKVVEGGHWAVDRSLEDRPLEDRPLEDRPLEDRPLEDLATEVAEAFKTSGAELAVLCSSDEIYPRVVPFVAPALKKKGARAVVLAGRPGDHEAAHREASVDHFIFIGCDAIEILDELWERHLKWIRKVER